MSKLFKSLFILFVIFASINVIAQETAEQKMCKDYPKLMGKYGSCIESQHAHYIFAIDVSTSMAAYESTVKENLCTFVNAVPDGDQISLIRVADTDRTGFVNNSFQNITISSDTRRALKDAIYSDDFRFNQDGSDMFRMAELIIQSINTTGSSDLVFIYMFTDFEYWTSKNKYTKPEQASWETLKERISASNKRLVKHGLELNYNNPNLRQYAIVKGELGDIFGKVEYQGAQYASVLREWFTHRIAEIMAEKLNSLVEQDWDAFVDSVVCDVEKQGNSIVANVEYSPVDLVSGLSLTAESGDSYFITQTATAELKDDGSCSLTLGKYNIEPNSWLPQYTVRGGNNFNILVNIESPYKEEINRLQQVCRDYTKCQESKEIQLEPPTIRLWDSHIPLWIWIVVAVILLIIIVSILYQFLAIKLDYSWQVVVMGYDAESNRIERTTLEILARDRENNVIKSKTTNTWVIRVVGKRYNPLLIFKKSGYYITLEQGGFLEIMDPYAPKEAMHTLQVGDEVFVCSYRKPNEVTMQIKADGNKYKIVMN